MTHAELVSRAVRWLRGRRDFLAVAVERGTSVERPDVLAWVWSGSVVIEAKVHRGDFFRDTGKHRSVGTRRFYAVPAGSNGGLIRASEVPDGWGLLWIGWNSLTVKRLSTVWPVDTSVELPLLLAALRSPPTPDNGLLLPGCLYDAGI